MPGRVTVPPREKKLFSESQCRREEFKGYWRGGWGNHLLSTGSGGLGGCAKKGAGKKKKRVIIPSKCNMTLGSGKKRPI